ncbi:Mitochondrial 2-oxoglutarate/malate carrier protein [Armadillidium vulgare]|nr:Mitochondrial 2-oxoglutarate/malate carrier protein [Armadillidium vulgare]
MYFAKSKEHKTIFHAIKHALKTEGISDMYAGLSAGLLRQATYTTTRLGINTWLFEMASRPIGEPPNSFLKTGMEMAAGTPADSSLILITFYGRLLPVLRRNYKNVFDVLFRITREEGVLTLWKGAIATMGRARVVNAAQLDSYSLAKQGLLSTGLFKDNIFLHFCASMISGLVTKAACKNKNSEYENSRRQTRIQRSLRRFSQTKDSPPSGNNLPHITCPWDPTLFSLSSS